MMVKEIVLPIGRSIPILLSVPQRKVIQLWKWLLIPLPLIRFGVAKHILPTFLLIPTFLD